MEYLKISSVRKLSFVPSSSPTGHLSSHSPDVNFPNGKQWNHVEKHMISQHQLLTRRHVGLSKTARFIAHSGKKNDYYVVPENPFQSEPSKSPLKAIQTKLDAFYRFSRPYGVIGIALSIGSVSLLAVEKLSDISPMFIFRICQAILAASFMHMYVVGSNQLSDIEIDKVNKPYLPLASGEIQINTAVILTVLFATMGLGLGWIIGSGPLLCALLVNFVSGTLYSVNVPYMRWKRFPFTAAVCIIAMQAPVHYCYYLHMQTFVLGRPALFSNAVNFATAFISIISVVQALFKDIPDIEGDKVGGIQSLAVWLGAKKVFWICIGLLQMAYLGAILVGLTSTYKWCKFTIVTSHVLLASILWIHAKSVDLGSKASIQSCYMFIWKLFYAEYFLIHLIR